MEDKWSGMEMRLKSWIRKNKSLVTVSVIAGFLLSPFIWPFVLAAVYTALSLAVPVFLILLEIKMPWRTDRKNAFSQGKDSQNGEIPEPEQEEKNVFGRKTGQCEDGQKDAAMSWYAQEGKNRILNLMKLAEKEGAEGISIRGDGICSAKKAGSYYRIGALRSFPGDYMELIAEMLKRDVRLSYAKKRGKYLCIFWNKDKGGCA